MIFNPHSGQPRERKSRADAPISAGNALPAPDLDNSSVQALARLSLDAYMKFDHLDEMPMPMDAFPGGLVTVPYVQETPDCAAHCALFFAMRMSGLAPATILRNFLPVQGSFLPTYRNRHASELITRLQKAYFDYGRRQGNERTSQTLSKLLTMAYREARLRLASRVNTLKKDAIVFVERVGAYNPGMRTFPASNFKVALERKDNKLAVDFSAARLRQNAAWPLSRTLFQKVDDQPLAAASELPGSPRAAGTPDSGEPYIVRTRFFLLTLRFKAEGRRAGHAILVDLSNPGLPGIFDPNYGWIAVKQGFCSIQFEQILYEIWRSYSGWQPRGGKGGMRHLAVLKDADFHISAFQLSLQAKDA